MTWKPFGLALQSASAGFHELRKEFIPPEAIFINRS
jgi:hypothetical protein